MFFPIFWSATFARTCYVIVFYAVKIEFSIVISENLAIEIGAFFELPRTMTLPNRLFTYNFMIFLHFYSGFCSNIHKNCIQMGLWWFFHSDLVDFSSVLIVFGLFSGFFLAFVYISIVYIQFCSFPVTISRESAHLSQILQPKGYLLG